MEGGWTEAVGELVTGVCLTSNLKYTKQESARGGAATAQRAKPKVMQNGRRQGGPERREEEGRSILVKSWIHSQRFGIKHKKTYQFTWIGKHMSCFVKGRIKKVIRKRTLLSSTAFVVPVGSRRYIDFWKI